jgi:signal peptidase I
METTDGNMLNSFAQNDIEAKKGSSKRHFICALASAVIPGLGQWLLRARRKGVVIFAMLVVVLALYWPLRLPRTYSGFLLVVWLTLLLFVASTWDALRTRTDHSDRKSRLWLFLFVPLAILISALHVNWLFRASGFRNYSLPSSSMELTIGKDNLLVADLWAYRHSDPRPYEVIIFRYRTTPYVKRVIAGPGSTIEGKDGLVIVDGRQLSEPYVQHTESQPPQLADFGPISIPANKYFVMGDNRDVSFDSRTPEFGLIDISDVLGKALYVYRSSGGWIGKRIQ